MKAKKILALAVFVLAAVAFAKGTAAKAETFKSAKIRYEVTSGAAFGISGEVRAVGVTKAFDKTEVKIPDIVFNNARVYYVTSIGDKAFYDKSITSVKIPDTVRDIGKFAFANNSALEEITLPESIESLGDGAFAGTGIKKLVIPDATGSIGSALTYGCRALEEVSIGKGVSSIGKGAFYGCEILKTVSISKDNASYRVRDGVLYTSDEKTLITALVPEKEIRVPKGTTTIADYAFEWDDHVESVTFLGQVKVIGEGAFFECANLKKVKCGDSLKEIETNAFYGCSKLEKAELGEGLAKIGASAFQGCTSLKSISLPASIEEISGNVFAYCSNLKDIKIGKGSTYTASNGAIYKNKGKYLLLCPAAGGYITIPKTVKTIGEWAFQGNKKITGVSIPKSVKKVLSGAFFDCSKLGKVRIASLKTDFSAPSKKKGGQGTYPCAIFYGAKNGLVIEHPSSNAKLAKKQADDIKKHCTGDVFILVF